MLFKIKIKLIEMFELHERIRDTQREYISKPLKHSMVFIMVIRNLFSQKAAKNGYSFALVLTRVKFIIGFLQSGGGGEAPLFDLEGMCCAKQGMVYWVLAHDVLFSVSTEQGVFLDRKSFLKCERRR